jgi:hypothetical protein
MPKLGYLKRCPGKLWKRRDDSCNDASFTDAPRIPANYDDTHIVLGSLIETLTLKRSLPHSSQRMPSSRRGRALAVKGMEPYLSLANTRFDAFINHPFNRTSAI